MRSMDSVMGSEMFLNPAGEEASGLRLAFDSPNLDSNSAMDGL